MRILFATWAWATHYFPMVPLARAFDSADHEVLVASQPALADTVLRSGLVPIPAGEDFDLIGEFQGNPWLMADQRTNPRSAPLTWDEAAIRKRRHFIGFFCRIAELMLDDLLRIARRWQPDLLVWDALTFAAPVVAQACGVPHVRMPWGLDILGTQPPDLEERLRPQELLDLYARAGQRPAAHLAPWTIDICPPDLQIANESPRLPMRYVPYNGLGGVLPDWLLEPVRATRRVCVCWGTSTTRFFGPDHYLVPGILEGLADYDAEIVVAATPDQRPLLGDLPANVRVAESLAISALMPSCSAFIHQGGAGTTLTAAHAGVPQLVVPQVFDQRTDAEQLAGTGAGRFVLGQELTPQSVRRELDALLADPGYAKNAVRLRDQLRSLPTPADLVPVLTRFAADPAGFAPETARAAH
uniref:Glycosyl transferase n=1 Tax=Streptomyces sp. SoC090715LN-16 TaxID=1898658 RepID=A0A3B8GIJ1_9ACTN|nr:glycosyl transferase [Streptomyces sp. SoC090715LN-16]